MRMLTGRLTAVRSRLRVGSGVSSFASSMRPILRCRLQCRGYSVPKDESMPGKQAHKTTPREKPRSTIVQPFHQRLGLLTSAFNAYSRSQSRSPLSTQFWSAVVIYLLADISAQTLSASEDAQGWDIHRTGRNLVIGGIVSIPGYKW